MKTNNSGFSLIELLVGIIIVTLIVVAGFESLAAVGVAKIKLIEKTRIEKEAYYATERFFDLIKRGGSIDYEEYWNRYSFNQDSGEGHFENASGFGNLGDMYYCESGNGSSMGTGGCLQTYNNPLQDYQGEMQRYGQYELQFIDHNSDADASGDEDTDGSIIGDADDLYLGVGPDAFPQGIDLGELYLINSAGDERTYFRWSVGIDTGAPAGSTCTGTQSPVGEGCLGTIEFLKLVGTDSGYNHLDNGDAGDNDGIIDTWKIHPDFTSDGSTPLADSGGEAFWQAIFSDTIHVKEAEFYLFPNKDVTKSWRDTSTDIQVAPYLQIYLNLEPSWKEKRKIRGATPTTEIRSTIQLLDIDL